MPGILDKGRSNKRVIAGDDDISAGNAKAIQRAYKTVVMLGREIKEKDWLTEPDVLDFLTRQEALCAQYEGDYFEHHKHQQQHLAEMRKLGDDMRRWLDKKLQTP